MSLLALKCGGIFSFLMVLVRVFALLLGFFAVSASHAGFEKGKIRITGSASVYPVVSFISENFTKQHPNAVKPTIESTGTGAGFQIFCSSKFGKDSADIVSASREITPKERELCSANGIKKLERVTLGLDAIVLAFKQGGAIKEMDLSMADLFNALGSHIVAEGKVVENKNAKWRDVRADLPDINIAVYGPSSNSGTYDFLVEVLQKHCSSLPEMQREFGSKVKERCGELRVKSVYIGLTDNDSVIARKVELSKGAIGVLRYAYFSQNKGLFEAVKIEGTVPSYESVTSKKYKIARPLFLYFNPENMDKVENLRAFLQEVMRFSYPENDAKDNPSVKNPYLNSRDAKRLIIQEKDGKSEYERIKKVLM